jgi:hypothetical protein
VKAAERLPGVDEILLPSERGNRVAQQRISSGMVPIEANLYNNLKVRTHRIWWLLAAVATALCLCWLLFALFWHVL